MEKFVRIATIDDQFEAQLLEAILTERGIPHVLQSYYDAAYDGIFQIQKGWGSVYAPLAYEEEILEILLDLRKETEGRE